MNEIKLEVIAEDGSIGSYILNINMLKTLMLVWKVLNLAVVF